MKLKLSRKLFLLNLKTVAAPQSHKVIIMKSTVVYSSFRLMRSFDVNNCVNTSINPILTGDKNLLFTVVSFSTWQGFVS